VTCYTIKQLVHTVHVQPLKYKHQIQQRIQQFPTNTVPETTLWYHCRCTTASSTDCFYTAPDRICYLRHSKRTQDHIRLQLHVISGKMLQSHLYWHCIILGIFLQNFSACKSFRISPASTQNTIISGVESVTNLSLNLQLYGGIEMCVLLLLLLLLILLLPLTKTQSQASYMVGLRTVHIIDFCSVVPCRAFTFVITLPIYSIVSCERPQ